MAAHRLIITWSEKFFKTYLQRWIYQLTLRAKVTLGVVLPLVLILGAFTVIETLRHQAVMVSNLSLLAAHSGKMIENNLHQPMLKSDFEELQRLLEAIGEDEEFRVVYLLDTSGKVIFASNDQDAGLRLDNLQPDCQPCHRLDLKDRPSSIVVTASDGQRVFRSMQPIENSHECSQCHDPQQRLIGLLLTDISMSAVEAPLRADLRESMLRGVGMILVTVLVVNLVINRMVLQRLARLARAIAGFGQGYLPPLLPTEERDEIGQLAEAFNTMAIQVEERSAEIQSLSKHLLRQSSQRGELLKRLITAQEDERKRVARELHDELGQGLSGLAFQVEAVENMIPGDTQRAITQLNQTRTMIDATTERMYDLILDLRPSVLDDLGLAAALRSHADRLLSGSEINFHLETAGLTVRLPTELETALYRTFQEALKNIVRHAGASEVRLTLSCQDGILKGEIVDNGRGFDLEQAQMSMDGPRGLGLLGMHERVAIFNGSIEIHTEPGSGTRIRISVPIVETNCG